MNETIPCDQSLSGYALDCKFLCLYYGLKFKNNSSFQLHLHAIHLYPIYQNKEMQIIFQEAARKVNYPGWLKLSSLLKLKCNTYCQTIRVANKNVDA